MTCRVSRPFLTWGLRLIALAAVGWPIFYFYWTIQIIQMMQSMGNPRVLQPSGFRFTADDVVLVTVFGIVSLVSGGAILARDAFVALRRTP
jgi:hypothetical protein